MKGVGMNLKSDILKLTILIMLVFVLIPVVSAENSTDTFYMEYDVGDDEVYIEEYQNFDNIQNDAQVKSASDNEIDLENDGNNIDSYNQSYIDGSINYVDDNIIIADFDSATLEPHDTIMLEDNYSLYVYNDFSEIENDVNESSVDGFTFGTDNLKKFSFTIPDLKFNLIFDFVHLTEEIIYCNASSFTLSNSVKNTLKNLDMKDKLLNNNFAVVYYIDTNGVVVAQMNEEDFNNKNLGDFVYSIDNSIIGNESICFVFFADSFFNASFFNNNFFMNDNFFEQFCCGLYFNKVSQTLGGFCVLDI